MRGNGSFRSLRDTNGRYVVNTPTYLGTSPCRGTVARLNVPYPLEIASNVTLAPPVSGAR